MLGLEVGFGIDDLNRDRATASLWWSHNNAENDKQHWTSSPVCDVSLSKLSLWLGNMSTFMDVSCSFGCQVSKKMESWLLWRLFGFAWTQMCVSVISYRYFLLRDHHNAVCPPDPDRCQSTLGDGFEGILCVTDKRNDIKSKWKFPMDSTQMFSFTYNISVIQWQIYKAKRPSGNMTYE